MSTMDAIKSMSGWQLRLVNNFNANKIHYQSIGLILLSYFIYTITMSCAKLLDKNLSIPTIVFVRCCFAYIYFIPMLKGKVLQYYYSKRVPLHMLRICLTALAMLCTYYTYTNIPISLATSIGFSGPILIACFAAIILKEQVRLTQWLAIIIGYSGVLIIIHPNMVTFSYGIITAILANVFAGLSVITMKILTKTEHEKTILLYLNTGTLLIMGALSFFYWTPPTGKSLLLLTFMGATALLSQFFMVKAMKLGKPSVLAPFEYSRLVFAIPIGILVFDETISAWMLLGVGILIASNYYVAVSNKATRDAGK